LVSSGPVALAGVAQEVSRLHVGWFVRAALSERDDVVDGRGEGVWHDCVALELLVAQSATPAVALIDGDRADLCYER
jgi:hypothetical protein